MGGRIALLAALAALASAAPAHAAPLGLTDCGPAEGLYQCSGLVQTWDGVPLDTTVTLPSESAANLPLVVLIHGFGNSKHEYLDPASQAYTGNAFSYAADGYAVLTYTARGLWGSCGTPDARLAGAADCARGYIHLADARFEVRDTQHLIGLLVDEGTADAGRIGVAGDSYGGGQSFMLAALKNRTMLPDGSLTAWRSPRGTPLRIAAAAPVIPWTDLVHAIAPNGRTLTYTVQPPKAGFTPVGVFKTSFANGIFAAAQTATGPGQPVGEPFVPGRPMGYLAPPGTDPEADVTRWVTRADQGEPYDDPEAQAIVETLERHHSAYYVGVGRKPAPLFIGTGFTDDLFPVDEAIRFVNRTRRDYPRARLALLLGDFGHQRAQNKDADRLRLSEGVHAWLDHHLLGAPGRPRGVTATTQTCPRAEPSGGPFSARSFAALSRGEVRFTSGEPQTVGSQPGDPATGRAIDPVAGGDACVTTGTARAPAGATYELPTPARRGYTLLGAPAVVADLTLSGDPGAAQIASRLWDVAPDGQTQTLVARGLYRPTRDGRQAFELHANGWRFAPGHVPKLELLGADPPYARPSNGDFEIAVNRMQLRLPVRERPGCRTIRRKARPVVPDGERLAPGVRRGRRCAGGQRRRAK